MSLWFSRTCPLRWPWLSMTSSFRVARMVQRGVISFSSMVGLGCHCAPRNHYQSFTADKEEWKPRTSAWWPHSFYYSLGICFLAALVFFHIMIQYFMHRWLSTQLEFSLLEVRHVCFICLCIYVTRDNGYENRNWSGWLYHILTVWPWTNYLISQRCCLPICNLWLKQH